MSYAIYCHDCDETVWPPLEAEGPGGRTQIAAQSLALDHIRESGHTDVYVTAGCYYVGDGSRPTAFGDGSTDPSEVEKTTKADLVDSLAAACRALNRAADGIESSRPRESVARHLRDMVSALQTHIPSRDLEAEL